MKVTITNGQTTIDAHDLGPLLDLAPSTVPKLMRDGEITSRFEVGTDADEGRMRLTFFHAGKRVRLTCDSDGNVLTTSRIPIGNRQ
ncbi:MAG: DUF6522 family protein [Sulfitobacter sp.]